MLSKNVKLTTLAESRYDMKHNKTPFTVCIVIVLAAAALFIARLADWQLWHGTEYKNTAKRSTGYQVKTEATRGEILDKNGVGLVTNSTHYKIVIDKLYADEAALDSTVLLLSQLVAATGDKWDNALPLAPSDGGYAFAQGKDEDVAELKKLLKLNDGATADECFAALLARYSVSAELAPDQQYTVAAVRYGMEVGGYSNAKPYVFASDVSRAAVSAVSENTQGIGGVDVQTYLVRSAANPTLAPHILGALGAITEEEYKDLPYNGKNYELTDTVGKFGIELAYEDELKGEGGAKLIQRNADGAIVDTVESVDAKPGNTIYLTLDSKLQQIAVDSLETNVKAAREEGEEESEEKGEKLLGEDCEGGAVVMLSVSDFSVLAAAGYPTYDLNRYSEYGDYYVQLANDERSPMYNRAFSGTFEWGSVFKPCVAMAALEEKVIKPDTIYCARCYDYYPSNVVACMHYHGNENLFTALAHSCNVFFAETGRRLGIKKMSALAEKAGLGEYTGIEIEESRGVLAGRDSEEWTDGNTVQAAIGQSDNAFTPVQMATYAATIANNGKRLKTHIVSKITDYERQNVIAEYSTPEQVDDCGVSAENMKTVQSAMLNVTQAEDGTAYQVFGDYKIKVAAKTGTAENSGSDHTTFICYAPYDNPQVAIAVVLEHGVKGKYSMQVAKDLLDGFF